MEGPLLRARIVMDPVSGSSLEPKWGENFAPSASPSSTCLGGSDGERLRMERQRRTSKGEELLAMRSKTAVFVGRVGDPCARGEPRGRKSR